MIRRGMRFVLSAAFCFAGVAHAADLLPDLSASLADFELDLDTNVPLGDVAELCASATHGVDLLRFSGTSHNALGAGDLVVGDPLCPDCDASPGATCGHPDFHCSPAGGHGHPHFTNYLRYELFEPDDLVDPVRVGGKFGFCLRDTSCEGGVSPAYLSCYDQGLSAGCSDLYSKFLGCQYIDVTGLPDGDYVVRVTADPEGKIPELDEENNASEYPVYLEGAGELDEVLPGRLLTLKRRRAGTRLELRAKRVVPLPLPSPPLAPSAEGAVLAIGDGSGSAPLASFVLPAEGWKGLGRPPGQKGYRYRGGKQDACRKAKLTPAGLTAICTGELVLPIAGELELVFTSGDAELGKRYCSRFGGAEKRNDAKRLKRVKAPAPGACPEP